MMEIKKRSIYTRDGRHMSKQIFLCEFFRKLNFNKDDIIILDRTSNLNFLQPLLENKNDARLITFLHSGHEFYPGEDNSSVHI